MGILNHLFGSIESLAREAKADEEAILKNWTEYIASVKHKRIILEKLRKGEYLQKDLQKLKEVLDLELVDISGEEKEEEELIEDLEKIEQSKKIKRIRRLEQCLGYAETRYEYAYRFLEQLHSILKDEIHIAEKLVEGSKNSDKLIAHIRSQVVLEIGIIRKIAKRETFVNLFLVLAKGEHIIRQFDSVEKRIFKSLQKIMYSDSEEGITHKWIAEVLDKIEDKFRELEAEGILGMHSDVDFELVNRPEFVDLVKTIIRDIRARKVSEQMINVFVHIFREWYNHERD